MKLAPIVIFAYNRFKHFQITTKYLKKNYLADKSDLIIYSDGPKSNSDKENIENIRKFSTILDGFRSIKLICRKKNYGLANNIISGVSEVLKKYPNIIVLEDDMITHKMFLKYMNKNLDFYKKNKNVASIHAYNYPYKNKNSPNFFFLKGADCWGWGTWTRSWLNFQKDPKKLIINFKKKPDLIYDFNFNNNYNYYKMLENNVKKPEKSWAIRWYASNYLKNCYTLYPKKSLIKNIGIDGSGENCNVDYNLNLKKFSKLPKILKIKIKEDKLQKKNIAIFFKKNFNISFFKKIRNIIR